LPNTLTILKATGFRATDSGNIVMIAVRSRDPNGKAFFAQAISEVDWTPLYNMDNYCDWMVTQFLRAKAATAFSASSPSQFTKSSPSAAWKTLVSEIVKLFHKFEGSHPK